MGDHCSRLIKNLLTKLIIFNRRRPAECAGLKVEDYKNAAQHEDPEKIVKSLTPVEQLSANEPLLQGSNLLATIIYIGAFGHLGGEQPRRKMATSTEPYNKRSHQMQSQN
ncbi:hypothetical protein EB796_002108 [Bugula neritina]|uniref:Uncharacterized protein n=1 Tax=Bugula neritina TaxID=10212 RepID=A0A7J7KN48_BUGNE|nr:hypothetical protein EB796_002108 [Bugula neritina]